MRPKSGLPKRKPIKSKPVFKHGLKESKNFGSAWRGNTDNYTVVSFFSGCGGMDLGFIGGFKSLGKKYSSLPFNIVYAADNEEKAVSCYQLNIDDIAKCADLVEEDKAAMPSADVLIGGFPCQDFSSSGPKVGLRSARGNLYLQMVDYLAHHQPKVFIAENVKHLARMEKGKALEKIVTDFKSTGYKVEVWTIYCPDFGLPQSRTRLFIVGTRNDLQGTPSCPQPSHAFNHVTIDDAISDLINITDETITNQSQYFVATRATSGGGQGDHTNKRGQVAYTIRANSKARIQFHYELDRRLTVRECARLQSFPDEFVFPYSAGTNMMHIGNAVPPIIGHSIAESIRQFLDTQNEQK